MLKALLGPVAKLISLRLGLNCLGGDPARVGVVGFTVCLQVQRNNLINILEAKAEAWGTQRGTKRERGRGVATGHPSVPVKFGV